MLPSGGALRAIGGESFLRKVVDVRSILRESNVEVSGWVGEWTDKS